MTEPTNLDVIYTTPEAAERLRISSKMLIKLGRKLGACSEFNGKYLFSEADILQIWHANRSRSVEFKISEHTRRTEVRTAVSGDYSDLTKADRLRREARKARGPRSRKPVPEANKP